MMFSNSIHLPANDEALPALISVPCGFDPGFCLSSMVLSPSSSLCSTLSSCLLARNKLRRNSQVKVFLLFFTSLYFLKFKLIEKLEYSARDTHIDSPIVILLHLALSASTSVYVFFLLLNNLKVS
jgi:hypothetical protein